MDQRSEEDREAGDVAGDSRPQSEGYTAGTGTDEDGVLTLVCLKCGTEYYFEQDEPGESTTCEKCGNTVFRSFYSSEGNEALQDFEDVTHRDLNPDDAEGDTLPGDVIDLNRD